MGITAVPQSDWRRPVGLHYTYWMATALWRTTYLCTTLPCTLEDAIELALDKPLWRQQAELRTDGACRI